MNFKPLTVFSKSNLKILFIIDKNEQEVDNFYKLLNEQHNSIKFTIE